MRNSWEPTIPFKTTGEYKAIDEQKNKNHVALFRKTITKMSKIKPLTLHVNCNLHIDIDSTWFDITVFDNGSDNRSFYFLPRSGVERNLQRLQEVIDLIKADNFKEIVEYKKRASLCGYF